MRARIRQREGHNVGERQVFCERKQLTVRFRLFAEPSASLSDSGWFTPIGR